MSKSKTLGKYIQILSGFPFPSAGFTSERNGQPIIRIRDLQQQNPETYFTGDYDHVFLISKGDVLVGMDGDFNAIKWQGPPSLLNQRVCKITTKDPEILDQGFLYHSLQPQLTRIHKGTAQTTVKHLSTKDLYGIDAELPPLPEQMKIAKILSGIDDLINSLTQQKQKLDASKAALSKKLISGLQGPRKESLYGQIPEHWNESTLGEVIGADNLQTGPFGSQLHAHEYTTEGIPVVMPQDMKKCRVVTEKIARITPDRAQSLEKHKVIPGDILFSRRGDIGRHAIISQEESGWICGTGCLRARTNGAINPVFLSELLLHRYALEWLNANAVGQTMLNLNTGILSGLPVVVPPKSEQDVIANALNSISNRSEKIACKTLFAQNLKASLSSDLLSGRKRVSV